MATTLHQRGMLWIRDKLPQAAGIKVEVWDAVDGAEAIQDVDATPGRRDFLQVNAEEFAGTNQDSDWIIAEQNLFFNGVKKEPQDGWEIRVPLSQFDWLNDNRKAIYRVLPDASGKCFDVVDRLGLMYRIHSKLDRIETPQA